MKFTLSWLKEYLDTDAGVDEITDRLTAIGLEVEEVVDPIAPVAGLIVAEVETCSKHPNSDHLHILTVNTGKETLQVVCGAPNARAGMKGILARPGDFIPAMNDRIKKGVVRGIESLGMMCSERELGLGGDHHGIIDLPDSAVAGAPLTSVYPSDPVFDVSITPNRGDCMSVRGIARDLAASGLGKFKALKPIELKESFRSDVVLVNDAVEKGCPLFTLREIRNVKNVPSPQWLQDRLTAVGLRPISALVDITNYFTLAYGRPLHVFDADKVKGRLTVRSAKNGEKMTALDGRTYELSEGMIVIADENGVQSLGGVMGGEATGCDENTTRVLLESAFFTPEAIARTGQKLQLSSDARQRFERGVDPATTLPGSIRAAEMVAELCGGEVSEMIKAGNAPEAREVILFSPMRVKQLCGIALPDEECRSILEKLGCAVTASDLFHMEGGAFEVRPPSWRSDITGEHDLVEEVLRIHGYDKLPEFSLPRPAAQRPVLTPKQRREAMVRRTLAARGGYQTITWSFMSSADAKHFRGGDPICLANPISSDLDEMRPSLVPNLLTAARNNITKGANDGFLFEIGPEFFGSIPEQQRTVACALRFGAADPRHWAEKTRPADVFDAKADALAALNAAEAPVSMQVARGAPDWYHPGRSGSFRIGKTILAYFGEIHPKILKAMDVKGPVVACEVFLDSLPLPRAKNGKTQKLLKPRPFMPIIRDLAFTVPSSVEAEKIVAAAKNVDKNLISDVSVFDLYEGANLGEGRKSVAIQLTLQPVEKTMTDEEIESVRRRVVGAVVAATGAELRG